ncbi:alpha-hydroxy-acid oxidizing protein [Streptomyces achromogenes]|uniref:alpha-hydroxy-acid oxidizing protein n=1 Tax=Streptomyces achromogenes TaxID=67255 RepID=UPI003A80660F
MAWHHPGHAAARPRYRPARVVGPGGVRPAQRPGRRGRERRSGSFGGVLRSAAAAGRDPPPRPAPGATAVAVGRSYVWGLAVGGREGVRDVVRAPHRETGLAMALTGVAGIAGLTPDLLLPHPCVQDDGSPAVHPHDNRLRHVEGRHAHNRARTPPAVSSSQAHTWAAPRPHHGRPTRLPLHHVAGIRAPGRGTARRRG